MKMNLPNKLSVLRLCMVPVFVVIMMASDALWANLVGCALFGLAAFTDMLDGKIARKYNLVTDFGKFLDPLADKFMVIGALLVILYKVMGDGAINGIFTTVFFWTVMIVIFRELAVTSIRLVVSSSAGIVVAANMLGKIKTVSQIVCICVLFIEPLLGELLDIFALGILSYVTVGVMLIFTVWSGVNYLAGGWKHISTDW